MESYGIHEVLAIKSYQISSYPKCYGSMVQRVPIIKGEHYKVHLTLWGAVSNPVLPL